MTDDAPANISEGDCAIRLLLALKPHFPALPSLGEIDREADYWRDIIAAIRLQGMVYDRDHATDRKRRQRGRRKAAS